MFLKIFLKITRILFTQIGKKLIDQLVFVKFHLNIKTLNLIDNYLIPKNVVTRAVTRKKSKIVNLLKYIV